MGQSMLENKVQQEIEEAQCLCVGIKYVMSHHPSSSLHSLKRNGQYL